jgi:hypothetical protein
MVQLQVCCSVRTELKGMEVISIKEEKAKSYNHSHSLQEKRESQCPFPRLSAPAP